MFKLVSALGAILLVGSSYGLAQTTKPSAPNVVAAGKAATALVDLGEGTATAFCITSSGVFVTNKHVIEALHGVSDVKLVLNAGESNERQIKAKVLRSDANADLGLLKADGGGPFTTLTLGNSDDLIETMEVTTFGFPFGRSLGSGGASPNISVSTGKITSLRKVSGKLKAVQLDASVNPGCSGGPVLNASGKVIGVIESGVMGGGGAVNFAVPVSQLIELLHRPELSFTPPQISNKDRGKLLPVQVQATVFPPFTAALSLELTLQAGKETRNVSLKKEGDVYVAQAMFLPPPSPRTVLEIAARYNRGRVEGLAWDGVIFLDGKSQPLKRVARIEPKSVKEMRLTYSDGTAAEGIVTGLETVGLYVGGVKMPLDLTKALSIDMAPESEITSVEYSVTARENNAVLGELSGRITVQDAAPSVGLILLRPTKVTGTVERQLSGTISDVAVGGGGRYVLLLMASSQKLAIFDVIEGSVVKELTLESEDVRMAAGADKFIIVDRQKNRIQRYRLDGQFAPDLTVDMPSSGSLHAAAMGSASHGPILMSFRSPMNDVKSLMLMDLGSLKFIGPANAQGSIHPDYPLNLRASANGTMFGMWSSGLSPSGIHTLQVMSDKTVKSRYEHESAGPIVPGADGRMIYTSLGPIKSDLSNAPERRNNGMGTTIPSVQGPYCITITSRRVSGVSSPTGIRRSRTTTSITICNNDATQTLVTLPPLESPLSVSSRGLTLDQRYLLMPDVKAMAVIPLTNDRIIIQQIDTAPLLKRS